MLHILGPSLFGRVAGAEIVITLRQTQAALINDGNLLARILEILLLAEAEESVHSDELIMREEFGQFVLAPERSDAIKLGCNGVVLSS